MSEQKPMSMDTAPKDGTRILGYGCHYIHSADYSPDTGWAECHLEPDPDPRFEQWCNITDHESTLTAWLPLPPTPTEET